MRIANKAAASMVAQQRPFEGSNMFARCEVVIGEGGQVVSDLYIVYSYGEHFPMYVAETDHETKTTRWYGNVNRYSRSTTRHQSQAHPNVQCIPMDTERMKLIARGGLMELVRRGAA